MERSIEPGAGGKQCRMGSLWNVAVGAGQGGAAMIGCAERQAVADWLKRGAGPAPSAAAAGRGPEPELGEPGARPR